MCLSEESLIPGGGVKTSHRLPRPSHTQAHMHGASSTTSTLPQAVQVRSSMFVSLDVEGAGVYLASGAPTLPQQSSTSRGHCLPLAADRLSAAGEA